MDVIVLRFDAPLVSFGDVAVDEQRRTAELPGLSLLTGLLGNALGYDHAEADRLQSLQDRLRYAVRRDRAGSHLVDYQTVDLGQPYMEPGWTTWGAPAARLGGFSDGTHIRHRHYWADAVFTVAVTLDPPRGSPDMGALEEALDRPARPLFIGRKCCLPAAPLLLGRVTSESLKEAVEQAPSLGGSRTSAGEIEDGLAVWWPERDAPAPSTESGSRVPVYDLRDWRNQWHTGRRFIYHGSCRPPEGES